MKTIDKIYIDGKFVSPMGQQILQLFNPEDGTKAAVVTLANAQDVELAVAAAKKAFKTFSKTKKQERGEMLERLAQAILDRKDELDAVAVREYGSPISATKGRTHYAAQIFLDTKEAMDGFEFSTTLAHATIVQQPLGVIAAITPWNADYTHICSKLAPAIATGCTIVIKPSELSAAQTQLLTECFHSAGETAKELSKAGIVAFVLKYRLSDSTCNSDNGIIALQDAQQAIYMIRKYADKWNIDPDKVGYLGFSAGGHLSLMAATHYKDNQLSNATINLRPNFTVVAYPVISFTDSLSSPNSKTRANLLGEKISNAQVKWYSPELNVDGDTPPCFLIHAADDQTALVENSLVYFQALHRNKVEATIKIYQKGGHGFANYNKAEDDYWIPGVVKWMKLNKLTAIDE